MVRNDPTIPVQLGQNSGTGLGYGQQVAQQYGVGVSGGSTVQASGSFVAPPGSPTSQVYMGKEKGGGKVYDPERGGYVSGQTTKPKDKFLSYDEANLLPTTWNQKELRDFVNKGILYKAAGFSADMGMPEIVQAWGNLVDSAQLLSKGGQSWSPWDVLNTYNQKPGAFGTTKSADGDWLLDARTGDRIKYIGPRSKTTTEKRVDLSSPEDVRALTTQMLTELLGRAPTAAELAKYRTSITGLEKANPSVATTTTTINDQGEAVGSSTTTSGGVSDAARQGLVEQGAKQGPEYGKFQSATTYFNAMMQMMGG